MENRVNHTLQNLSVVLSVIAICISSLSTAQIRGENNCFHIVLQAKERIIEACKTSDWEKIESELEQWEYACSATYASKILEAIVYISKGELIQDHFHPEFILDLTHRLEHLKDHHPMSPKVETQFQKNIIASAQALLDSNLIIPPFETFFLNRITDPENHPLEEMNTPPLPEHAVGQLYLQRKEDGKKIPKMVIGVGLSYLDYSGIHKNLGQHPGVNLFMGGTTDKWQFNLFMEAHFGRTAAPYEYLKKDSLYSTQYFSGGMIGLEYGRYVLNTKPFGILVKGGLAYNGWSTERSNNNNNNGNNGGNNNDIPSINAFNQYFGLEFSTSIRTSRIALQPTWHFAQFKNKGGTPMTGLGYFGLKLSFQALSPDYGTGRYGGRWVSGYSGIY